MEKITREAIRFVKRGANSCSEKQQGFRAVFAFHALVAEESK
jgi:hypothetical protein